MTGVVVTGTHGRLMGISLRRALHMHELGDKPTATVLELPLRTGTRTQRPIALHSPSYMPHNAQALPPVSLPL